MSSPEGMAGSHEHRYSNVAGRRTRYGNGTAADGKFDNDDVEALQAELARVLAYNEKLKDRMREENVEYEDISDGEEYEEQLDGDMDNVGSASRQGDRLGVK